MSSIAVLGCMWGDEAKAKIVDVLGECADMVVRFQGGSNAGHTIHLNKKKYVFHSIPSGILYPETVCVIASGVVIDVFDLLSEIEDLEKKGISFKDRLLIDPRVTVVLPLHKELDAANEDKSGKNKIGTTRRGIGPAYSDDRARTGIRLNDLFYKDYLQNRLLNLYKYHDLKLTEKDLAALVKKLQAAGKKLSGYIAQTDTYIRRSYLQGDQILFEGAQGTLLDITFGTYPYVTSSNTIAGGISTGAGIPLKMVDKVIGVYKAYCTRVGEGPFPTELKDKTGDQIRIQGNEFGATTGRPRRCGWLDAVAAKYTSEINGVDRLAVTLLDVLSGFEELKICTAYWIDGNRTEDFPADPFLLEKAKPEYLTLKGWDKDITNCKKFRALPKAAKDYLEVIQDLLAVPIELISVGKERSQTIIIS
ncbi:MAG: adenylosuccinate synthase [Candidatus Cloacimonadaceae bacterium]